MGGTNEKDAILQEFAHKMLHSYPINEKACTNAGFPVHLLDIF